jgi:hypothetical protein
MKLTNPKVDYNYQSRQKSKKSLCIIYLANGNCWLVILLRRDDAPGRAQQGLRARTPAL